MKKLFAALAPVVTYRNCFSKGKLALVGMLSLSLFFGMASRTMAATEYDVADVDTPPKIIRQMPVKFPAQAKKDGVTGKVVVRCLIDKDGKADRLEIVESEPAGVFDDSALSTLKYWQFRPGIKKGDLVATWVKIPFKFE